MDRDTMRQFFSCVGCPLTRGDGPENERPEPLPKGLSPHAGGWTVVFHLLLYPINVVPSRGGMDRGDDFHRGQKPSCPLTRGDGPVWAGPTLGRLKLSPHAGGWTGKRRHSGHPQRVVPSRGGMDRAGSG